MPSRFPILILLYAHNSALLLPSLVSLEDLIVYVILHFTFSSQATWWHDSHHTKENMEKLQRLGTWDVITVGSQFY